jgi:hypothetical protein
VTEQSSEGEGAERTNWIFFWAWFLIGASMLLLADAGEKWEWPTVVIDVMVHVGATLLLAPLLPFVERSLTRRVVQENRRMVRQETAGLHEQVDSLSTRVGQLQGLLGQQDAENTQSQDQIIETLATSASFWTVAEAMTVANQFQAIADGAVTLTASTNPRIDLTFAWQTHIGDGRFSEPGGTFLSIEAHVDPDPGPGAGTPVIQTIWNSTEKAETVAARINDQLRIRDRWNGPGTIDWDQVFRDLHRALRLAVAYKRRDTDGPWQLHGELFELHGTDWAITKAGIEYRPANEVVLSDFEFPERHERNGMSTDADIHIHGWNPAAPQNADSAEWQHVLWRGLFHLPVDTGPLRAQPTRFACKTMPSRPETGQPQQQ